MICEVGSIILTRQVNTKKIGLDCTGWGDRILFHKGTGAPLNKLLYVLRSLSRTEILIVALKETHEERKTLHIPQLGSEVSFLNVCYVFIAVQKPQKRI